MTQQTPVNTQAPQDIVIQSGFLNHFRWATQEQRSGWIYINKSDGKDQQGKTQYRSVLCQVFGNTARMLSSYFQQIQSAKSSGQRMSVLVQFHAATISSFTPTNNEGAESNPVTIMKGFKAYILNSQDRMITDYSDDVRWNDQNPQQSGYTPQQAAPQRQQQSTPYQAAPQKAAYIPQQAAPQQAAPQGNPTPMAEPDFDFDDDIPF
jgi:hypothetical protein